LKGEQVVATKNEWKEIESIHLNNIVQYVPELKPSKFALKHGCFQVSTVFEVAVAINGGYKVVSKDTHDLSDGSDCKLSSSLFNGTKTYDQYRAPVSNVRGKKGKLRVQVYNRLIGKFFYFVIPKSARTKTINTIQIPFNLDGTPQRSNKWWKFEKKSFIEMCTA
jgi:hypothetical protein